MGELLLSYLFPKFRGSKEDIVTLSMCHIIESSQTLNKAFTDELCRRLQIDKLEDIHYQAQATGKNRERPDISGKDSSGAERIICEAKFFAGLTDNQPNAYLNRLIGGINTGLIFICPEARVFSLWKQITERVESRETIGDMCVSVYGAHMSVISWSDILGVLYQAAKQYDPNILADLDQLDGLCRKIENTEFIPFSDDDLSISAAKSIDRYYMVVDDVIQALLKQDVFHANTDRQRAVGGWGYYTRYITISGIGCGIGFSTGSWKASDSEATPFWFWLWNGEGRERLESSIPKWNQHQDGNGQVYFALTVPRDTYRDEVIKSLTDQVLQYIRTLTA